MTWKLDKPIALSWDGWDEWRDETKAKYPVKYFLQESVPDWFRTNFVVRIWWRIRDQLWKLKYRFIRKHQYNIIRPRTLSLSYQDECTRILHANMECLSGFMEHGAHHIAWEESSEVHANAYNEMKAIHVWWTENWPNRDTTTIGGKPLEETPDLPEEWGMMSVLSKKYDDEPLMIEYKRVLRIHSANDSDWRNKEVEMLVRLMKIHQFLWA